MTGVPNESKGIAFTNWLVSKAAGVLERKSSRRGFILGSAMVGSAVAVAGCAPGTQPGTPYSHITDCGGGLCTDGYTEFCCTINNGLNACPPGSFIGGWWRADYSSFCNGTRYYMDCMQNCCGPNLGNGFCAGCTECTCAGGCDTRRIYCNYFRYGQCHQEIGISGPIACRVVTCTPPYTIADYACSTAAAVDNSTAEHAPAHGCAPPPSAFVRAAVLPSTGGAVATSPGNLAIFARTSGGGVNLREFNGTWRSSSVPAASLSSGLSATMAGSDLHVFHRGTDNAYWVNRRPNGGGWPVWQRLGGNFVSDPSGVGDATGVYVFGRGADGGCWYSRNAGGGFSAITSLGGSIDSDPAAISDPTGVFVFARGTDNAMWFRRFVGGSPGSWTSMGGTWTSDPAACSTSTGPIVATRGVGNAVWVRYLQGGNPITVWQNIGGTATSDPAICSGPSGTYVFIRGTDNGIWFSQFTGGSSWTPFAALHGTATSSPVAVSDTSGVSVFYIGSDNGLWTRRFTGGSWSVEQSLGGTYAPVRAGA
jgi:hypothetical protein